MKKVYIIGTGGFGAELTDYINDNNKNNNKNKIEIVGYLDHNDLNYKNYTYKAPFLGSEKEFDFPKNSVIYMAIGNSESKKNIIKYFSNKSCIFENFIHHSSIISSSAKIGIGNIICPNVIIGPNTKIGNYNLINYYCTIPHDCSIGNYNIFSPSIQIGGYCNIGDNNLFGISSGVIPSISIGNNNKIQFGIIVDKIVGNDSIVFSMNKVKSMKINLGK